MHVHRVLSKVPTRSVGGPLQFPAYYTRGSKDYVCRLDVAMAGCLRRDEAAQIACAPRQCEQLRPQHESRSARERARAIRALQLTRVDDRRIIYARENGQEERRERCVRWRLETT